MIYFIYNIEDDRDLNIEVLSEEEEDKIDDIKDMDLEELLTFHLTNRNYRAATRIEYLLILQKLDLNKEIKWSIEKTNRDYISELRQKKYIREFKIAVNLFERVWYGNRQINKGQYIAFKETCLLYTSPSPRDRQKSRMPSSA